MFLYQMEEMLLTSRNATSHGLRENKGGPYYLPGLISFRHLIILTNQNEGLAGPHSHWLK